MKDLAVAINRTGKTKQSFAEMVGMPYYRVVTVLYGQDSLTESEREKIEKIFGAHIFLP